MGDTSNWEFAAVVAAVSIGLCGLLLYTLVSIFTSWRVHDRAARAARDASEASLLVQDLARQMGVRETASLAAAGLAEETARLGDLRKQIAELAAQQARLQDAVRKLLEANVLGSETRPTDTQQLQESLARLDDHMAQLAAAIAAMAKRDT